MQQNQIYPPIENKGSVGMALVPHLIDIDTDTVIHLHYNDTGDSAM